VRFAFGDSVEGMIVYHVFVFTSAIAERANLFYEVSGFKIVTSVSVTEK
jgi:hypothetical protein